MMNEHTENIKRVIRLSDLVFIGIFILAFSIRIYAANMIGITNSEAGVLLSAAVGNPPNLAPFFYTLFIRILNFLGVNSDLGMRLLNVLLGSFIILLPALFSKEIGKRTAILASIMFALDPFAIVNSVVISGNAATILLSGLLIDAIIHKRNTILKILVSLLVGHGRGFGYLIMVSSLFAAILFFWDQKKFDAIFHHLREMVFTKRDFINSAYILAFLLATAIIFKVPLSNISTDFSKFIVGWGDNYQLGNYPIVYPFALFSYIPVALVFSLLFLFLKTKDETKQLKLFCLWYLLAFLILMFYPGHLVVDLTWVSLPLWICTASLIHRGLLISNSFQEENLPFLGILIVSGINLGLNIITVVYRAIWGLDVTNALLAALIICIFIVALLVFKAYATSITKALSALFLVILFFCGVVQISISARAAGVNQKPENEILWNGYFEGKDIVEVIIAQAKSDFTGTSDSITIYSDSHLNPSLFWLLRREWLFFRRSDFGSESPQIIISNDQADEFGGEAYQGQEFISNSYPLWTWDPVRSFISTDYWNWFFFRNNLPYQEYNSIWINKSLLDKKISVGE